MTREELTARLAECEGYEPGKWSKYYLHPHLATALREAWAEIDRMKLDLTKRDSNPLDAALNEGDGGYRP